MGFPFYWNSRDLGILWYPRNILPHFSCHLCIGQIEASTCPPRATPRAFDFFENYRSNSPLPGPISLILYGVPFPPKFNVPFYLLLFTIYHFVFVIWVCARDSTFLHSKFNFDLCNIQAVKFSIRPSSSVECTFTFSHPTFSICPLSFPFPHPTLGIVLARWNFYPLVSDRWRSWAQSTWPTTAQMVVESRSRDFPVEWTQETFYTPDN